MKKYICYGGILLLSACANHDIRNPTGQSVPFLRYEMTPSQKLLAQAMAAYDLKDPDSAKFRDMFFATRDSRGERRDKAADGWCIEVNGKNSYGAYVGFTWSYLPPGGKTVYSSASALGPAINQICGSAVYPPQ